MNWDPPLLRENGSCSRLTWDVREIALDDVRGSLEKSSEGAAAAAQGELKNNAKKDAVDLEDCRKGMSVE